MIGRQSIAQTTAFAVLLHAGTSFLPAAGQAQPRPQSVRQSPEPVVIESFESPRLDATLGWPTEFRTLEEHERWQPTPDEVHALVAYAAIHGIAISPDSVERAAPFLSPESNLETRAQAALVLEPITTYMLISIGVSMTALFVETWLSGAIVPSCEEVIEALIFGAVFGAVSALLLFRSLPKIARIVLAGLHEAESLSQDQFSTLLTQGVPEHLLFGPVCDLLSPWRWTELTTDEVASKVVDLVWDTYGAFFVEATVGPLDNGPLATASIRAEDASRAITPVFESDESLHWVAGYVAREAGTFTLDFWVNNQGQDFLVGSTTTAVNPGSVGIPLQWTGSVATTSLLDLDQGADDAFELNLMVGKDGEVIDIDAERRPTVIVRSPPNEPPVLLFDTKIVSSTLSVEGRYFDPDGDPPTVLDVSIGGTVYDLAGALSPVGEGAFAFSQNVALADGIHPVFLRVTDGNSPIQTTAVRQIRASATPPAVDLKLSVGSITLGQELPFTVSVSDAAGPVPNREIQLARDGRGGFKDASGAPAFRLTTNASGVATGTYVPGSPGLRTLLARERVGNVFDFETVSVENNNPEDWECALTWTLLEASATEATYRCDVVITFQGALLDVGDRVFFSSNHGVFEDEFDQVGASGQATNRYTLTVEEAESGPEIITIGVPEWDVEFIKHYELPVLPPESFDVFRTIDIQTFPGESETLSVSMSDDGRLLAGIDNRRIRVRELPSLSVIQQIDIDPLGGDEMTSVDFSPDGTHVVAGDEDGNLVVANVATGSATFRSRTNGSANIMGVSWPADDRIVAITDDGNTSNPYRPRAIVLNSALTVVNTVFFPDYQVGSVLERLMCVESNSLCAVASRLAPSSWYLFTASGTIVANGTHPDSAPVYAVSISRRGDRFVVGGDDNNGGAFVKVFQTNGSSASELSPVLTTNTDIYGATFFDDEFGNRRLLINGNAGAEEFSEDGGGVLRAAGALHANRDSFHLRFLEEKGVVAGLDRSRKSLVNVSGDIFPPTVSVFGSLEIPFAETSTVVSGSVSDPAGVWTSEYRRDGGSWLALELDAAGEFAIEVADLPVGETLVEIRSKDYFANESTTELVIVRLDDTVGPTVINWLVDPLTGEAGTVFTLSCQAFDADSEVASVSAEIFFGGSAVASCEMDEGTGNRYQCAIDSSAFPLGTFEVNLTSIDTSPSANATVIEAALSFDVVVPANRIFSDGFESGDTSAWSQ